MCQRDKGGACANGAIGYRRKLRSVEITLPRDIVDFVNKTSRDKGGKYSNEKWKPCNWISSDITPGRNYPTLGYWLIFLTYVCPFLNFSYWTIYR